MKKINLICSIFLFLLAIAAFSMASTFPSLQGSHTGPGSFPKILSVIIGILSIILFVQSILNKEITKGSTEKIKPAVIAMTIIFIYLLSIKWFGFFYVTPFVIIVFLIYAKVKHWMLYVGLPVGVIVFVYFIFEKMLQVPLPNGSIFA